MRLGRVALLLGVGRKNVRRDLLQLRGRDSDGVLLLCILLSLLLLRVVRVRKADPTDSYGDIHVDTAKSHEIYKKWLAQTRPAEKFSPNGERRPYWMLRPLKPAREFYKLKR